MKKIISLVMAAAITITAVFVFDVPNETIAASTSDNASGTFGDALTWTFDEDTGTLTIGGSGDMPDYDSALGVPWYKYNAKIYSVGIQSGVKSIGKNALRITNLQSVSIPNTVTSIGDSAFYHCTLLEEVKIPGSVTTIMANAFCSCSSLEEIEIPKSVVSIKNRAFADCTSLKKAVFKGAKPNSFGSGIFDGCTNLTEIRVPCAYFKQYNYEMNLFSVKDKLVSECDLSSAEWKSDDNQHWHECPECGATDNAEAHSFENGVCTVCGYGVLSISINEDNFPDTAFREYVKTLDTDGSGTLSAAEIDAVQSINVNEMNINDLKGIELFTGLYSLNCCDNSGLTNLDLSKNTKLSNLNCRNNANLSRINFGNITTLTSVNITNCGLEQLDVSRNTGLLWLYCCGNKLTSLDISQNTSLQTLECHNNKIAVLNISRNTALKELNCSGNELTSLDTDSNTELERLVCERNHLGALNVSKNKKLTTLFCGGCGLSELDVTENTALNLLDCDKNSLSVLDLSKNSNLNKLYCNENNLTFLDLSATNVTNTDGLSFTCVNNVYNASKCYVDTDEFPEGFDTDKMTISYNAVLIDGRLIYLYQRNVSFLEHAPVIEYEYDCGNGLTASFAIFAEPHNAEKHERQEAGCTTVGKREYWSCSDCECDFIDEKGSALLQNKDIAAIGHDWNTDWSKNDTHHWHDCLNNCGEKNDNAAHIWDNGTVTKQPTAAAEGEKTFECTVCGKTKMETLPPKGEPGGPNSGNISVDVQPGENVPATKLEKPFDELVDAVLTSEEQENIKNGIDIKIILIVSDATQSVPKDDKAKVEAALGELSDYKLGQYLDLNLLKIIGSSEGIKITQTNKPLTVTFEVPAALRKKAEYSVIRVHGGETGVLSDLDSDPNTVTIETDKFSTYTLVYKDVKTEPEQPGDSSSEDNDDDKDEGEQPTQLVVQPTQAVVQPTEPAQPSTQPQQPTQTDKSDEMESAETGDRTPIALYGGLVVLSMLVLGAVLLERKKRFNR